MRPYSMYYQDIVLARYQGLRAFSGYIASKKTDSYQNKTNFMKILFYSKHLYLIMSFKSYQGNDLSHQSLYEKKEIKLYYFKV